MKPCTCDDEEPHKTYQDLENIQTEGSDDSKCICDPCNCEEPAMIDRSAGQGQESELSPMEETEGMEEELYTDGTGMEMELPEDRMRKEHSQPQVAENKEIQLINALMARISALEQKMCCPCEAERLAVEEEERKKKEAEEEEERLKLEAEEAEKRQSQIEEEKKARHEQFVMFLAALESKVSELDKTQVCPCKKEEEKKDEVIIEEIGGEDELSIIDKPLMLDTLDVFGEDELDGEYGFEHGPSWVLAQITSFLSQFTLDDFNQLFALVRELRDRILSLELSKEEEAALLERILALETELEEIKTQLTDVKEKTSTLDDMKATLLIKADRKELETKVEHSEYVAAVEDLSKSIQETIDALAAQVERWERQNEENQKYLEGVLNEHVLQIKEYLQEKLSRYTKKLNFLANVQRDIMSMGSIGRPELMRGQNCVTCGAGIVMRTEGGFRAPIRALKPRSMRIRAIGAGPNQAMSCCRKLTHCQHSPNSPGGDNGSADFFEALAERVGGEGKRHVGGSHTKTTAEQRVIRTGDFKKDFL